MSTESGWLPRRRLLRLRVRQQQQQRKRVLKRSQECDLRRIEEQVKAFYAVFKRQHGRSPKPADLKSAANIRMKVVVERYHLLKHTEACAGTKWAAGRARQVACGWSSVLSAEWENLLCIALAVCPNDNCLAVLHM